MFKAEPVECMRFYCNGRKNVRKGTVVIYMLLILYNKYYLKACLGKKWALSDRTVREGLSAEVIIDLRPNFKK